LVELGALILEPVAVTLKLRVTVLIVEFPPTDDSIAPPVGAATDSYTVVGTYTVLNSFATDGVATAPVTVSVTTAAGAVTVMYTSFADALAATV
jgi:hypothetical protein